MPKILTVAVLFALLIALSQFARTSTDARSEQVVAAEQARNDFSLKKSYQLKNESADLLATIYACGLGLKKKEILSIWSRGSDAYELQYIKAAANGQSFVEPLLFSIESADFIRISTLNKVTGDVVIDSVLSLKPDSTLAEMELTQFKEIVKTDLSTR